MPDIIHLPKIYDHIENYHLFAVPEDGMSVLDDFYKNQILWF